MVEEKPGLNAPGVAGTQRRMERRLAAILGADIKGYSILMAADEEATHRRVGAAMARVIREVERHNGRVFFQAGDGLMAEFPSAVEALKCGLRVQCDACRRNARLSADQRIDFRVGINSGEIVVRKGQTGGHAVNVAARLEPMADPGGILLSQAVFDQVSRVVSVQYDHRGEFRLKHIREPVVAYRIAPETCCTWTGMPALARRSARTPALDITPEYRPSLAVLPFRSLQADQADAYFAEGMVDDIIRVLAGLKELFVIARSSTLGFARAPLDLRRVGHELDVRYVLHGSVRRAGEQLRIAVELNDLESRQLIWADRFDGGVNEIFELQDRIAVRVANAVAPHVRERELVYAARKHPSSLTAYDLTLRALDHLYRMDRASFFRAHELLGEALAHDQDYAPAYSHLAYWHVTCVGQGWSQDVQGHIAAAEAAARSAIERDRNDPLALALFGHYHSYLRKDYARAAELLDRALAVGPSNAWAWSLSSLTCGYVGELDAALKRAELAVRLSPIGPDAYWHEHVLSQADYLRGQYKDAVAWGRVSEAHCGAQTSNLRTLIASQVALGNMQEARRIAHRLLEVDPTFRLAGFKAKTPLGGDVREQFAGRLRLSGLPE